MTGRLRVGGWVRRAGGNSGNGPPAEPADQYDEQYEQVDQYQHVDLYALYEDAGHYEPRPYEDDGWSGESADYPDAGFYEDAGQYQEVEPPGLAGADPPEALPPDPDALPDAADDETAAYEGRRRRADQPSGLFRLRRLVWSRLVIRPRRLFRLRPLIRPRRVAIAAVAVGLLLVGIGVAARLLTADPVSLVGPPPTPPPAPDSPDETARLGDAPSASPVPSPPPTSTSPPEEPTAVSFEAEAAEPGSHGQVVPLAGASGGQAVKLSGARDGTFVQFSGVSVATSGSYDLTIFFAAEQDRAGAISVGDGSPASVTFPSPGGEGTLGAVTVPVQLAAGDNTLVIGTSGGAPLFVDQITITG
jgi:hypothetical protein